MSTPKKKAFSYLRVSTKLQSDAGSEKTQRVALEKYAQQHDITILEEFFDDSSGKDLNRPQIKLLLSRLHEIDCLLVYDQSRLTRSTKDFLVLMDLFALAKIEVIGALEPIQYKTPYEKFHATVSAATNQLQKDVSNIKVSDGIHRAIAEGKHWGPKFKIMDKAFEHWYTDTEILCISDLAKLLRVHRSTVYAYMKRNNIDYHHRYKKQAQGV